MNITLKALLANQGIKRTTAFLLVIGLLATAGLLLTVGSLNGIASWPGFLGSRAHLFADINLVGQFMLLAGLSLGVYFARRGQIQAHQYIQTSMVLFNILLSLSIMIPSFTASVLPGLPGNLITVSGILPVVHGGVGMLAVVSGVYLLLRMNRLIPKSWRIKWWKTLMRITFVLYWVVGLMGLALYYVWYIS